MRHFKHKILFGVLPLLAVFSLSGTSIKDVEPLKQPTPTKLNANVESSNDIYHLFYDDEAVSIELLFNSRPAAYKHFTKDTFKELADSLVEVIKEIGKQQIDLGGDLVRSLKTPTRAFDIPIPDDYTGGTRYDIDEYISAVLKTQFVYNDEIIDEQLLDYVYGNNEAYAVITTYFGYRDSIAKAGEDADEETFKQIAEEYSQALINALGGEDRVEEVVDVPSTSQAENVTEYIADQIFDLYFKEKLVESEEEYQLTAEDLSKVIDVATSAVNSSETDIVDGKNTVATLNQGNNDAVKDDVTNILEDPNLTSGQMVEIITSGDPKTINEIVIAAGVTGETFKDGLNVMTGADIAEVTEALGGAQGLKDLTQGISGLNREDLAELVIGKVKLADIIAMTKNITINGHEIMNDKHISFKEVQKILRDLPKFHDIRNFSDDEMRETFAIQLDTNVGTLTFDLTLGLFGNCDYIRKIASFLDDTFDFRYVPSRSNGSDGTYEIRVRSPENLYKAYYRFLESDYFVGEDGDAFKHEIIDIVFSSFDEIREYVRNKDIDTLAAELKTIDYATIAETVLSAEEWNDIFGNYYHLTDAKVDRAINGFFKLIDKASTLTFDKVASFVEEYVDISKFTNQQIEDAINKIFEYCGKVANRNFNADVFRALADKDDPSYTNDNIYAEIDKVLGDSGRRGYDKLHRILLKLLDRVSDKHNDKHLMDYYEGDSHFVYNENITINFQSLLESAKKYIPDSIYPNIEEFVDSIPTTFHIDADVHIPHVHSITYVLAEHGSGEEAPTKVLALPLGAHVAFPVNQTEINGKAIAKWVDANGNEVDTMPDEDIVVYAYVDYEISIQDNTPDIYSGEGSLEVALDPEVEATYQWYKSTGAGDEELDGETNPSISLVNVEDNGSYYCVASFLNGRELTSEIVTVDIQPADIDIGGITWGTDVFTYDGQDHEFKLENIPQNVAVRYTLDGTELDPGVVPTGKDVKDGGYVVIPTLSSTDSNYKIPDDDPISGVEHVFTINVEEITLGEVSWLHGEGTSSDPVELSYGVAYNLAAEVEGGLPDGVILTYKLNDGAETSEAPSITALGDYHVTAIFRTDENHVFVGGETEYTFDSYYTVEVHEIDLSNLAWVGNFEYDTTAHEFVLDLSSLEDYEIDALDIVYTYGGDEYTYPEVPTGINPGDNYVVSVAISVKPSEASNYIIKDGSFVVDTTHTFVIDRGTVHQADFVWTDEIDLDYVDSSTTYGIALVDEGVATVVYGGSTHDRGKHEMSATVSVDTAFYRLLDLEGNEILSGTFDMDPQEYYVRETIDPEFTFDDVEVIYDEANHSIVLVGDNLELFNVAYTYDGVAADGQTNVKYENDQVAGYAVNATISLLDEDLYKLVDGAVLSYDAVLTINPQEIDVSDLHWDDSLEFVVTYSGQDIHTNYVVSGTKPAHVNVEHDYSPTEFINVGNYTVEVTVSPENDNYVIKEGSDHVSGQKVVTINPVIVHIENVVWPDNADNHVVYNPDPQFQGYVIEVTGIEDEDLQYMTIKYDGSEDAPVVSEADTYNVHIVLEVSDPVNYVFSDDQGTLIEHDTVFYVDPYKIDVEPLGWMDGISFTQEFNESNWKTYYDSGIVGKENIQVGAEYVNISYIYKKDSEEVSDLTNAGTYNLTLVITSSNTNYVIDESKIDFEVEQTITINPQEIDVSGLKWSDSFEHTVTYTGDNIKGNYALEGTVPEHVVLDYKYSTDGDFVNAGSYWIKAVLSLDPNNGNYVIVNDNVTDAKMDIVINPVIVHIENLVWPDDTVVYNPDPNFDGYSIVVTGIADEDLANMTITYNGSAAAPVVKDADTYVVDIHLETKDSINYVFSGNQGTEIVHQITFVVNPYMIDVSPLHWDQSISFVQTYNGSNWKGYYNGGVVGVENIGFGKEYVVITYDYHGVKLINAGTYTVTVTVSSSNSNYLIDVTTIQFEVEPTIKILPIEIDISAIKFSDVWHLTYIEGDVKQYFELLNLDTIGGYSDIITLTYENDQGLMEEGIPYGIHYGSYNITATLVVNDSNYAFAINGVVVGQTKVYNDGYFSIGKLPINIDSLVYNPVVSYDYIPEGYSFELVGLDQVQYKEDVIITYTIEYTKYDGSESSSSDVAHGTNSGTYVVTAYLSTDNDHRFETGTDHISGQPGVTYTINRVGVDISTVDWKNPAVLQFEEGHAYEFTLKGLPDGVSGYSGITYQVSDASEPEAKPVRINAGTYGVTATLALDSDNYYFILKNNEVASTLTYVFEREFVIKPIVYDLSTLKWNYSDDNLRYYNFEEQSVELVNVPYVLEVTYTGNKGTNIGSYTASADVKLKDSYIKTNYNIINSVADLAWSIDGKTNTTIFNDEKGFINVVSDTLIQNADLITVVVNPIETKIDVTELDLDEWFLRKDVELVSSYEMKFVNEKGETVDMKSLYGATFTVTYNIPKHSQDAELVHMFTYGDMKHVAGREEGKNTIVFTTDVLGKYTVVKSVIPPVQPADEGINIAALIFVTGGSTLTISAFYIIITFFKKKTF